MTADGAVDALLPLSVVFGDQHHDVAVPPSVTLAEILPHIVESMGRLTLVSATQGYGLITQSGRPLDQSRTLAEQGVSPGATLTLTTVGPSGSDVRYDDLAEAIGHCLDTSRAAWRREDSVTLSAYSSMGLLVAAAVLTAISGMDLRYALAIDLVGAILATLVAVLVSRTATNLGGAIALALTAPAMTASAGWIVGPAVGLADSAVIGAGVGMAIGSIALFLLPAPAHPATAAPLIVGVGATALGLGASLGLSTQQSAAALVAVMTVLTLVTPWIGMASIPARIPALSGQRADLIDIESVGRQVRNGGSLVLSIRISCAIVTVALTPVVGATVLGALLMVSVGFSLMLATRTIFGRAEAMVGVVAGLATIMLTGVVATLSHAEFLPWAIAVSLLVAVLVLANNVVSPRLRPALSRVADVVHVLAIIAIIPLAVLVWNAQWA